MMWNLFANVLQPEYLQATKQNKVDKFLDTPTYNAAPQFTSCASLRRFHFH